MPWALAKDEAKKDRLATVLYNLVEGITMGATLLESFMPETTERILAQLNAEKDVYKRQRVIFTRHEKFLDRFSLTTIFQRGHISRFLSVDQFYSPKYLFSNPANALPRCV